jgi:hypothetical protein
MLLTLYLSLESADLLQETVHLEFLFVLKLLVQFSKTRSSVMVRVTSPRQQR